MGTWNEELAIPLKVGEAQSSILQLNVLDATLREEGLKACTFRLGDFVPWNGYHLNVRNTTAKSFALFLDHDDVIYVVSGGRLGLGFAGQIIQATGYLVHSIANGRATKWEQIQKQV